MMLYKYLKETLLLDELKRTMIPHLHKIQELIEEYYYSENKNDLDFILEAMINELNSVVSQLTQLDYTYEPEVTPDENEESFKTILVRYKDQISDFISHFSEDKFEAFNTQTRFILNLIDVHRTNFIEEGEILIDEQE